MPSVQVVTLHPSSTVRRGLRYEFTPKHHGADSDAACWLTELGLDEEFAIFDRADGIEEVEGTDPRQIADEAGNLYGYELIPDGTMRVIGTWYQQLAEFPVQVDGAIWHGYPIWPLKNELAPENRRGEKCRPTTRVFDRLLEIGVITRQQRKRLGNGKLII